MKQCERLIKQRRQLRKERKRLQRQKRRLRYRDLEEAGYGSRTTIWRRVKAKTFVLPHDDGNGKPIWYLEDIEAWEDDSELLGTTYP